MYFKICGRFKLDNLVFVCIILKCVVNVIGKFLFYKLTLKSKGLNRLLKFFSRTQHNETEELSNTFTACMKKTSSQKMEFWPSTSVIVNFVNKLYLK